MRQGNIFGAGTLFAALSVSVAVLSSFYVAQAQDSRDPNEEYYAKRQWDRLSRFSEGLNISSFVFRDVNLNGIYDMGDRPISDIAFELSHDGNTRIFRSNITGVANYRMSATNPDKAVTEPGRYTTRVIIPPGWYTTTKELQEQSTVFELLPGSPADMFSHTLFKPIGLAPKLSISGHVKDSAHPNAEIQLRIVSPDKQEEDVPISPDGFFGVAADRGAWKLIAENVDTGVQVERTVLVGQTPAYTSTIDLASTQPAQLSQRRVTTFDDLFVADMLEIPQGYNGINWEYFNGVHNRFYLGAGYINNTVSGEYVAYNASGHPVAAGSSTPVDFVGGYFGLAWLKGQGETLIVKGWRQDKLVYEDEFELSALGPVYFDADYRGVTRVELTTKHYWQVVMDDLEFGFAQ